MATSAACGLCGAPDSWRHSLIECTMARCTWALVDEELGQSLVASTEPNTKQWLFSQLESLSHALFVRLAVTLWAIWSSRRKAIHEGVFQSPQSVHSFVTRFIAELEMIKETKPSSNTNIQARVGGNVRRRPRAPPQDFAKIHVDAGIR